MTNQWVGWGEGLLNISSKTDPLGSKEFRHYIKIVTNKIAYMYIEPNVFGDKQTNSNNSKVTAYYLI